MICLEQFVPWYHVTGVLDETFVVFHKGQIITLMKLPESVNWVVGGQSAFSKALVGIAQGSHLNLFVRHKTLSIKFKLGSGWLRWSNSHAAFC